MPSIKEQDLLTRTGKFRRLAPSVVLLLTFVIFIPVDLFFPTIGEEQLKDSHKLVDKIFICSLAGSIYATVIFACLVQIGSILFGDEKFKNKISVLRVTEAKCSGCNQFSRMEVYQIVEGVKKEVFDGCQYSWNDTRTGVHCTACGCDLCYDEVGSILEEVMEAGVATGKNQRRKITNKSEKDSLTKPLLSSCQIV